MNKYYRSPNGIVTRAISEPDEKGWVEALTMGGHFVFLELGEHTEEITPSEAIEIYDALAVAQRERILGMKPLDPKPWVVIDQDGSVGYRAATTSAIRNPVWLPRPEYEKNRDYYA